MPSRENVLRASSGSNLRVFDHQQANDPKRSRFDLSRITNYTCDSGMIVPFDWFETVPGDSFDLSSEVAIESLPTVTSVLTPYHVRTYWFYCRNSDLWAGWETFVTRGRSGNLDLRLPLLNPVDTYVNASGVYKHTYSVPHSLQSFLGCLPLYGKQLTDVLTPVDDLTLVDYAPFGRALVSGSFSDSYSLTGYNSPYGGVSALPFMMYQNICKYYFVDENLLQGNKALFPEQGDSDWRLPYVFDSSGYVNTVSGKHIVGNGSGVQVNFDGVYGSSETEVGLAQLRYAQFEEDYFTSGLPWLQRGASRTLDFDITLDNLPVMSSGDLDVKAATRDDGDQPVYPFQEATSTPMGFIGGTNIYFSKNAPLHIPADDIESQLFLSYEGSVPSSITANQLRELIAYSVWQERNARVDGSYNAMIWVHFSENPKSPEHQARFIGGTSSYINFSEIYQQSESGDTPLGTVSARGSLYETQRVGRFNCPDYGIIMGIMVISPMVTYNTSLPHELVCPRVYDDFYMPEFEGLSPQPILNKEIYPTGDLADNNLFAWQERYSWLKSRQNVNRGLFRLPGKSPDDPSITASDILFSSATQSRDFKSLPSYSYQFKVQSRSNTRRDWLAYPKEPMFKVQVASKVDAVRPMSYVSRPATFGM